MTSTTDEGAAKAERSNILTDSVMNKCKNPLRASTIGNNLGVVPAGNSASSAVPASRHTLPEKRKSFAVPVPLRLWSSQGDQNTIDMAKTVSQQDTVSGRALREEANQRNSTRMGQISDADKEIIKNRRTKDQIVELAERASEQRTLVDRVRHKCKRLIEATWFDFMMGICVAFNAATMVLEYELQAGDGSWQRILDEIFLIVFFIELMVRFFVYGRQLLQDSSGILDVFVVATGIMSQWILPAVASGANLDLQTLQVLKVLRVARCVRVLRMLTMFRDLWIIVMSFFGCLGALMWTIVFMMIVIFIFGMFGVELIGHGDEFDDVEVQKRFRRPVPAMLCLFQIMSLDNWKEDIVSPLLKAAPWTYLYVLLFIGIGPFALMNLVTAVVVESSVKRVREDKEYQQQIFEKNVARRTMEIQEFWKSLVKEHKTDRGQEETDKDCDINDDEREMDIDDFLTMAAPHPFLQQQMMKFDMTEAEDFAVLFKCLDSDESNSLELSEVIRGVLKLQQLAEDKDKISLIKAAGTPKARQRVFAQEMSAAIEDSHTMLLIVEGMIERIDDKLDFVESQMTASRESIGNARKSELHQGTALADDLNFKRESNQNPGRVLSPNQSACLPEAISSDALPTNCDGPDDSTAYLSSNSLHQDASNSVAASSKVSVGPPTSQSEQQTLKIATQATQGGDLQRTAVPSKAQLEHLLMEIAYLHKAHDCRLQTALEKSREAILTDWRAELVGIASLVESA